VTTLLVTGGAGFIGSNFVRYIYKKYPGYKIIVLDALTYAASVTNLPENGFNNERFEFWYGNVLNATVSNYSCTFRPPRYTARRRARSWTNTIP
jgi:dTDP-D-glucose 4,6-dehydratase